MTSNFRTAAHVSPAIGRHRTRMPRRYSDLFIPLCGASAHFVNTWKRSDSVLMGTGDFFKAQVLHFF